MIKSKDGDFLSLIGFETEILLNFWEPGNN